MPTKLFASSPVRDLEMPSGILPRSAWADGRPPLGPPRAEDTRFLLVHHTAGRTEYSEQGAIEEMQGAYDLHTSAQKGWPDVAYNFFIDRFGRVFEARAGSLDGPVVADATGGNQGFAQLVCLLGDFTSVMPTAAAIDSLVAVLAWLADRSSLDTTPGAMATFTSRGSNLLPEGSSVTVPTISGHRDVSRTACPGDTFYPFVHDGLQRRVDAARRVAAATTTTTGPPMVSTTAATGVATTVQDPKPTTSASPLTSPTTEPEPDEVVEGAPGDDDEAESAPDADGSEPSDGSNTLAVGVAATAVVGLAATGYGWSRRRARPESSSESGRDER